MPTPDPSPPAFWFRTWYSPVPNGKLPGELLQLPLEDSVKKGAGDNDAQRAALQAEEQDRQMMSYGFHVPY